MADDAGFVYAFLAVGRDLDGSRVLKIGRTIDWEKRRTAYMGLDAPDPDTLLVRRTSAPVLLEATTKRMLMEMFRVHSGYERFVIPEASAASVMRWVAATIDTHPLDARLHDVLKNKREAKKRKFCRLSSAADHMLDGREDKSMDPLSAFLTSDEFHLGPGFFMPMRVLKDEIDGFRRNNGHNGTTWTSDDYSATFEDIGLKVVSGQQGRYVYKGQRLLGDVVLGIRPVGVEDQVDAVPVEDLATWVLRNYEYDNKCDEKGFAENFIPLKDVLKHFKESPLYVTSTSGEKIAYTQDRLQKEIAKNQELKPLFRGRDKERLAAKYGKYNKAQGLVHLKLRATPST